MAKSKKSHGFLDIIKDGLIHAAAPINRHMEKAMQNFEDRLIGIEERVMRKMLSFALIGLGTIFLALALFFYLREFLGWSNSAAYFSIGALLFVMALVLKVKSD